MIDLKEPRSRENSAETVRVPDPLVRLVEFGVFAAIEYMLDSTSYYQLHHECACNPPCDLASALADVPGG